MSASPLSEPQSDATGISRTPAAPAVLPVGFTTLSDGKEGSRAPIADIIFVHGLGGHPEDTWTFTPSRISQAAQTAKTFFSNPFRREVTEEPTPSSSESVYWPRDLLPQSIRNARILTYGYHADIASFLGTVDRSNVFRRAGNLLEELVGQRLECPDRPIIFVTHSLGGILVKDVLKQSADKKYVPELQSIYNSTYAILFLGTPHRGSNWVSIAENASYFALGKADTQILHSLQVDSETLQRLTAGFAVMLKDDAVKVHSFMETQNVTDIPGFRGKIVEPFSAVIGEASERTIELDANHRSMCKFTGLADSNYAKVLQAIAGYVRELAAGVRSGPQIRKEKAQYMILEQLSFAGMSERKLNIAEAHKGTFEWVYRSEDTSFIKWLRSGQGIYWISGKAASGKSTLMKLLFTDERTLSMLSSVVENPVLGGFFFHDRGNNALLKSQLGLFRAVLYQLLSIHRQLIPVILPRRWEHVLTSSDGFDDGSYIPWTLSELKEAFKNFVEQNISNLHVCLFIDGLDEFDGDYEEIINVLGALIPSSGKSGIHIQLCLSSRPYRVFEAAYEKYPHLLMQDLTRDDISLYVRSKFSNHERLVELGGSEPKLSNQLVEDVVNRASGVFLWVHLVVKSLLEGLRNRDTITDLQRRLMLFPKKLDDLFWRMVNDIEDFYKDRAAQLFQIVNCLEEDLTVLGLSLASEDPMQSLAPSNGRMSGQQRQLRETDMADRLGVYCSGLLEIEHNVDSYDSTICRVQPIHLTFKQFVGTARMRGWLQEQTTARHFNPHVQLLSSCLWRLRLGTTPGSDSYPLNWSLFETMMKHATKAKSDTYNPIFLHLDIIATLSDSSYDKRESLYWQTLRYGDWSDPTTWESDYISYMIELGMSEYVTREIARGYKVNRKTGRPLLFYALFPVAPGYAVGYWEWDTIDPQLVQVLLRNGADPNERFLACSAHDIMDHEDRTPWEAALFYAYKRLVLFRSDIYHIGSTEEQCVFFQSKDEVYMRDLGRKWLESIGHLVNAGADVKAMITITSTFNRRPATRHKLSALTVFNRTFADRRDELVEQIREKLIKEGAGEKEQQIIEEKGDVSARRNAALEMRKKG